MSKEETDLIDEYCELSAGDVHCKKSYHKRATGKFTSYFLHVSGHEIISVKGRNILKHRAIYYLSHGIMPELVEHIDRNEANNSICNLRSASKATNSWNRGLQKNSTTGVRGVTYMPKSTNKWGAHIKVNGKRIWLGSFSDIDKASAAYTNSYNSFCASGEIVP